MIPSAQLGRIFTRHIADDERLDRLIREHSAYVAQTMLRFLATLR
jgi:hypothetical protein